MQSVLAVKVRRACQWMRRSVAAYADYPSVCPLPCRLSCCLPATDGFQFAFCCIVGWRVQETSNRRCSGSSLTLSFFLVISANWSRTTLFWLLTTPTPTSSDTSYAVSASCHYWMGLPIVCCPNVAGLLRLHARCINNSTHTHTSCPPHPISQNHILRPPTHTPHFPRRLDTKGGAGTLSAGIHPRANDVQAAHGRTAAAPALLAAGRGDGGGGGTARGPRRRAARHPSGRGWVRPSHGGAASRCTAAIDGRGRWCAAAAATAAGERPPAAADGSAAHAWRGRTATSTSRRATRKQSFFRRTATASGRRATRKQSLRRTATATASWRARLWGTATTAASWRARLWATAARSGCSRRLPRPGRLQSDRCVRLAGVKGSLPAVQRFIMLASTRSYTRHNGSMAR